MALATLSEWQLRDRDVANAVSSAQKAVEADSTSAGAHVALGAALMESGQREYAAKSLREALRLSPRLVPAQVLLSRLELVSGNAEEAARLAADARMSAPSNPDVLEALVHARIANREYKEAEGPAKALLEAQPKRAEAHSLNGLILLARDDRAGARAAFDRALAIEPASRDALEGLLALDLKMDAVDAAVRRIEAALREHPQDAVLYSVAARTYAAAKDPVRAERALRSVLQFAPNEMEAYIALGRMYAEQNRLDEALKELDAAARSQPGQVAPAIMAGMVLELQGKTADARARYEAIVNSNQKAPVAANNLAWLYAEGGGNLDVARQLAQSAKSQLPDAPEINDTLGWIYVKKDLPRLAIPLLEQAVAKDGSQGLYHAHLGVAYAKAGDLVKAKASLGRALKLDPKLAEAPEVRKGAGLQLKPMLTSPTTGRGSPRRSGGARASRRLAACRRVSILLAMLALSACSDPRAEVEKHLKNGEAYLKGGKPQEAVVELRNAIQLDPRSGKARYQLAEAYAASGNLGGALQEYVRAADLLPADDDAQIKAATYLIVAGRFEDAKTRIQPVVARSPASVDAQIVLGNALAGLKDLDGAVKEIQEAISLEPTRAQSYTNLAVMKLAQGLRDEAKAAFEKAVAVDPKSATARLALANFQWGTGDLAGAEESLKRALEIDPKQALANQALATFYIGSRRLAEAEPYLKAAAELAGTGRAQLQLADYYLGVQRFPEAKTILEKLAGDKDTASEAASRLAALAYDQGDKAGAVSRVDGVLARDPSHVPSLLLKSRWLALEGKPTEALVPAQSAVKVDPSSVPAHFLLGTLQAAATPGPGRDRLVQRGPSPEPAGGVRSALSVPVASRRWPFGHGRAARRRRIEERAWQSGGTRDAHPRVDCPERLRPCAE